MKSSSFFFLLILFAVAFSSCSINEKFEFNEDMSGHYSFQFDYSELLAYDSSGSANMEMDRGYVEMEEELKKIDGISNILIITDNSIGNVLVKYDFANIDALNQANFNSETNRYNKFFSINKNKLSFTSDFSEELEEFKEPGMNDEELLENIESFIDYKMTFVFPKKIKVIKLNHFEQMDDKTLQFSLTKENVLNPSNFEIKYK
jgi:hypothetical protein